jgi:hypothetical protein
MMKECEWCGRYFEGIGRLCSPRCGFEELQAEEDEEESAAQEEEEEAAQWAAMTKDQKKKAVRGKSMLVIVYAFLGIFLPLLWMFPIALGAKAWRLDVRLGLFCVGCTMIGANVAAFRGGLEMWKLRNYRRVVAGSRALVYGSLAFLPLGFYGIEIGVSSLRLLQEEGVKSLFSSEGSPGDGQKSSLGGRSSQIMKRDLGQTHQAG